MENPAPKNTPKPAGRWRRITISAPAMSICAAAFVFFAYNATYWTKGIEIFSGHMFLLVGYSLIVYFLTLAFFALFSFRLTVKPFLIIILILSAATSYYMDRLGVMIDRDMIQNVVTTTLTESKHLITADFVTHVVVFGIVPSLMLFFLNVKKQKPLARFGAPLAMFVLSWLIALSLLMGNYKSFSAVARERKDLLGSYQPGAPIVGAVRYVKMITRTANSVVMPLGEDAAKGRSYARAKKPVLTIIVAGETARSQNFSLNGYARPTNPELAQKPVISFANVNSCGTATAVSLPCMFSNFGRSGYSFERGAGSENLLDVLRHAGFAVEWWDNNTGDKDLAARIKSRKFTNVENAEFCPTGECDDGIFLQYLKEFAPTITEDTVLVLHEIGSHGPTYYLRYPESFEKFKPACHTAEFKSCAPDEIANAYDNTIAYTDHILSQTIDFLASQKSLDTSLLYISDHGESLGESGLYLHGTPYFMAPSEQTKVPMIFWMSPEFQTRFSLLPTCLKAKSNIALSHDNLFHSVLGMLDVTTQDYTSDLDI
ncbi:MAG: phosphoethanolamine--lipid A transferase, partial [Paracoccaceae bacterium]|nr:phosphoethanolamine--lipid A transferase [Paracoccaceae bacterium]